MKDKIKPVLKYLHEKVAWKSCMKKLYEKVESKKKKKKKKQTENKDNNKKYV